MILTLVGFSGLPMLRAIRQRQEFGARRGVSQLPE
jgi:hypothetical protein